MTITGHANRDIKAVLRCRLGAAAVTVGAYAVRFVRITLTAALAHTPPAESRSRDIRIRNDAAIRFPRDTTLARHEPAPRPRPPHHPRRPRSDPAHLRVAPPAFRREERSRHAAS
ncbi:hypothetical protein GCM10010278_82730 [Streptomyces melanogenes]|nr:hypothetical protein GCM10010278_82730 [Streptomyces melanogenes]